MIPPLTNSDQFSAWIASNTKIPNLRKSFISGAPISGGQAVCIGVDGKVYPYTIATNARYIGVAERDIAISCEFVVVLQGYLKIYAKGWSPTSIYYAQDGGNLTTTTNILQAAIGVGVDQIIVLPFNGGGSSGPTDDGYAKSLMLMGG